MLVRYSAHLISSPVKDLVLGLNPGVILQHVLRGDLGLDLLDKRLGGVVRVTAGQSSRYISKLVP